MFYEIICCESQTRFVERVSFLDIQKVIWWGNGRQSDKNLRGLERRKEKWEAKNSMNARHI